LTISPIERQRIELELKDKKIGELEMAQRRNEALDDRIKRQDQAIETILKKLDKYGEQRTLRKTHTIS